MFKSKKDPLEQTSVKSRRITGAQASQIMSEPVWVRPQPVVREVQSELKTGNDSVFDIAKKIAGDRKSDHELAIEAAYQRGFDEGKAAAEEVAATQWKERSENIGQRLEVYAQQVDHSLLSIYRELVDPMTDLALQIAKKACATELEITPTLIGKLIWDVCKDIGDRSEMTILMNPEDLHALKVAGVDLAGTVAATNKLKLVPNSGITRGGCVVETPAGTWDARWETRWKELTNALLQKSDSAERIDA